MKPIFFYVLFNRFFVSGLPARTKKEAQARLKKKCFNGQDWKYARIVVPVYCVDEILIQRCTCEQIERLGPALDYHPEA